MQQDWQPNATLSVLKKRAELLAKIRQFFASQNVLEVETPAMSQCSITDVHLHPFSTIFVGPQAATGQKLFLQTSPEFHMKRLLAAGSGSIYQIAKAFRNEEAGRYHNPEFTLLEWYKVDFTHHQLMDEMDALLGLILNSEKAERQSYQDVFISVLGICPLESSLNELKLAAAKQGFAEIAENETDRDTLLQLLFSMCIEPKIGQQKPIFVYDFPATQAALARVSEKDSRVAARFEVYFKGIELANGFYELKDAKEQLKRFEQDNEKRIAMSLPALPIDHHLIAALAQGFPDCAGVALGLDRLFMLALGKKHIDEVIAFNVSRA